MRTNPAASPPPRASVILELIVGSLGIVFAVSGGARAGAPARSP